MSEDKSINMSLWDSVSKTNPKHTKKASISGMKITAICPQYQRKSATEVFGPFGTGWGVDDESYSFLDFGDGTKLVTYMAHLWYRIDGATGRFPIQSNGKVAFMTRTATPYLKVDDEYAKKTATDALTKGLSMLGFNSDIFEGKYDDNKYVNQMKDEFKAENKAAAPVVAKKPISPESTKGKALLAIRKAGTEGELTRISGKLASMKLDKDQELLNAYDAQLKSILKRDEV